MIKDHDPFSDHPSFRVGFRLFFETESICKTIEMVMVDEHFYRIHLNGFAGRFVLKRRKTTSQKWAFATHMVISHVFVT